MKHHVWRILAAIGACLALGGLTACPSGTTGLLPFPVFLPRTIALGVPAGTQDSGSPGEFSLSWSHGMEPFGVVWTFDGGTTQEVLTTAGPERESAVSVTFDNPEPEAAAFSGFVVVTDDRGNTLREDFSFSVAAAP